MNIKADQITEPAIIPTSATPTMTIAEYQKIKVHIF